MLFLNILIRVALGISCAVVVKAQDFPSTWQIFSSNFSEPTPPLVDSEYRANWNQHKWNAQVSHIASGFLYNSPTHNKVRVDEAFNSSFGSSLFDYNNVTKAGVSNRQWLLSPAIASRPTCYSGYVDPGFPLISSDLLVKNKAVFGGVINDPYVGQVSTWELLFQGQIPTKILLNSANIIQGYDFWSPNMRTYVVTRYFNIILGPIPGDVFKFPCV